jgi:signal transduction histidine kinase
VTERLTVSWRVGLIVLIGLIALQLVLMAAAYMARGADRALALPQPSQVAAIVDLIEGTPPADRGRVVAALRSAQMSVRVSPEASVVTDLAPLWPTEPHRLDLYALALNEREVAAYAIPRGLFAQGIATPLTAAEFRVQLRDGGVLLLASESTVMLTPRGLPIGFAAGFVGVIVALTALIVLSREFRPLVRLARAVEAMDLSDADARLPEIRTRTAEVRILLRAFERLQDRIATLLRARAVLVGGIQHDVRTFATRLRLRMEAVADPAVRARAETDIADLVALMDDALLATRSDAGELDLELLNVADLVAGEIRDMAADGHAVSFHCAPAAQDAQVLVDRISLRRMLANLVGNAVRYGETARVALDAAPNSVVLMIDDDGPGIPEERRALLLEPFTRLDTSRARQTGGAGLGLAIVRGLVERHKGSLTIAEAPSGGARILVTLPRFGANGSAT